MSTTVWDIQPFAVWNTISSISIDFNVISGQNVYFSLLIEKNFDDSSNPDSYVQIRFEVDGIMWANPRIYVRRYNIVSAHGLRMSASVQHYNTTTTSGPHTVTLVYRGSSTADSVRSGSLFVQTFN